MCGWSPRLWPSVPFSNREYAHTRVVPKNTWAKPSKANVETPLLTLSCYPGAVFLQRAWTCPVTTRSLRPPWRVSGARLQPLWGSWTSHSSSGGKERTYCDTGQWVWSQWVPVNLSSCPSVRIKFTPVGRSLTQQRPSASQPGEAPWWTLRSGLSLSPWFFTMQVCDHHLCCNSGAMPHAQVCVCVLSVKPSQPALTVLGSTAISLHVTWRSTGDGGCRLRYRADGAHAWTQVDSPPRNCLSWISECQIGYCHPKTDLVSEISFHCFQAADTVPADEDQTLTYSITDLLPFTMYGVAVACRGESHIWSDWSAEVTVGTLDISNYASSISVIKLACLLCDQLL